MLFKSIKMNQPIKSMVSCIHFPGHFVPLENHVCFIKQLTWIRAPE